MIKPVNPDTSLPNKNTLYLGGSGCGKSQALVHNKELKQARRVILWDVSGEHEGIHTESRQKFLLLLRTALLSSKPYRLGFCGNGIEDFEWLCRVVWGILDGRHLTYFIAEELSQVCKSTAKASENAARLLNQGRKYGLVFHGVSQKPQEISKTFFDQCERKYIGKFAGDNAAKMAKYLGKGQTAADIEKLEPLSFLYDDGKVTSKTILKKFNYKKPKKTTIV